MKEVETQYHLSGVFDLLTRAFALFKARFKTLLGIALIGAIVSIILSLFSSQLVQSYVSKFLYIPVILIFIIFSLWSSVALLCAIVGAKENIGIKESYRRSLAKIHSYYWISLISIIFIVAGFALFLVPGVIFSVWFCFSLFVLVSENLTGITALIKSRDYVKGMFFKVWGRLLAVFLSFVFVFTLFAFICGILYVGFFAAIGKSGPIENVGLLLFLSVSILFGTIIKNLIFVLTSALALSYSFLLYEDVKIAKEGMVFVPTKARKNKYRIFAALSFIFIIILLVAISIVYSMSIR